jgi:hypothetical protein
MASRESRRVDRFWKTVRQSAVAPRPDDLVSNAQWDVLAGEPGGVDYLEPGEVLATPGSLLYGAGAG